MVIHTGDIVDTEGNRTQWQNANQSMSILPKQRHTLLLGRRKPAQNHVCDESTYAVANCRNYRQKQQDNSW